MDEGQERIRKVVGEAAEAMKAEIEVPEPDPDSTSPEGCSVGCVLNLY